MIGDGIASDAGLRLTTATCFFLASGVGRIFGNMMRLAGAGAVRPDVGHALFTVFVYTLVLRDKGSVNERCTKTNDLWLTLCFT